MMQHVICIVCTSPPTEVEKQAKRMLAFDTLFSCQGARFPARLNARGASHHNLTEVTRQDRSASPNPGSTTGTAGIEAHHEGECKSIRIGPEFRDQQYRSWRETRRPAPGRYNAKD
jgi:hypothetical protein